jgi:hypothetical protein
VLPEDDANRQLANGFILDPSISNQVRILNVAGGWRSVVDSFTRNHIRAMETYPDRFMVLLIDFDRKEKRLNEVLARVPPNLSERVFVLGVLSEPEDLKKAFGSYESIGLALAKDCREETATTWGHELLHHNFSELDRLRKRVIQILFNDQTRAPR